MQAFIIHPPPLQITAGSYICVYPGSTATHAHSYMHQKQQQQQQTMCMLNLGETIATRVGTKIAMIGGTHCGS